MRFSAKHPTDEKALIKQHILKIISNSAQKQTPNAIKGEVFRQLGGDKKDIKQALKELVANGDLIYTYVFGSTYLEKSFNKPVRVSNSVVLKPHDMSYQQKEDDIVVNLYQGISFGTGQHPTTRLSIQGIEHLFFETDLFKDKANCSTLDIGTGSGILAITSVLMGIRKAVGIDIDPCAIKEAKENVSINGLEDRISITDRSLSEFNRKFSLVTANLRAPTLRKIHPDIVKLTEERSGLVLSGLKSEEAADIIRLYSGLNFHCSLRISEMGWACVVFSSLIGF